MAACQEWDKQDFNFKKHHMYLENRLIYIYTTSFEEIFILINLLWLHVNKRSVYVHSKCEHNELQYTLILFYIRIHHHYKKYSIAACN